MDQSKKKRSLFNERLLVDIPEAYQVMDIKKAEMMYPYEKRPQIMLEDKAGARLCTFSLLKEQRLSKNQVEEAIHSITKIILSLYPSSLLQKPEVLRWKEGGCGWFAFQTSQREGKLYNIMYVFPVDGWMMLGTMGCRMEDEAGKKNMIEIMNSLEIPEVEPSYVKARKLLFS